VRSFTCHPIKSESTEEIQKLP